MTHDNHGHDAHAEHGNSGRAIVWIVGTLIFIALVLGAIGNATGWDVRKWLFLIPLLPGLGALTNGLFLNRLPKPLVWAIAVGTIGTSFLVSVIVFMATKMDGQPATQVLYNWMAAGTFSVNVAFTMDGLSGLMALVVSGVGALIHIYSIGYMAHDDSYPRFFTYLNLFAFAMLILVLGNSLPLMFVGWEGVGLCSYLLIGFWFTDNEKASAGKKAFIVNRIGDMGFVIGMMILFLHLGTLDYAGMQSSIAQLTPMWATIVGILLFIGASGKSAQIPLYVWLPDAMAGPTPVSALIHAATMVTAGVYMIARLNFLYVLAPNAMVVVAIVGAITAFFAATIGLFQYDIKKVLAYSTVSQLGYMFLAVGVGAFAAGVFHLMTHAFFKACLFLGSGSVIHGMHEEQDIRKMGGLKAFMPITERTFLISCIAIAGFPPLAAFFSKDEILYYAFSQHYGAPSWLGIALWVVGAIAAAFTSFYMFRLYYMTFTGECRAPEEIKKKGIHESPYTMTVPLIVLAALAIVGGWIGFPHVVHLPAFFHSFHSNLADVFAPAHEAIGEHHGSIALEWTLMGVSTAIAFAGWWFARVLYKDAKSEMPDKLKAQFAGIHKVINNKYYVDEGYYYAFIRPTVQFSLFLWGFVDRYLIDGLLVNVNAWVFRSLGMGVRLLQTGNVQTYILAFLVGAASVMFYLWSGVNL